MQKFILIALVLGLAFFLYLLQTDEISKESFNISKFRSSAFFEIRESDSELDSKSSEIYAVIKGAEYKVFSFYGKDFKKLIKAEYPQPAYKVPLEAKAAVTGTWLGNRYIFYILEKIEENGENKVYEIYKAEYSTDDITKLNYFLIKTVKESDFINKNEVTY